MNEKLKFLGHMAEEILLPEKATCLTCGDWTFGELLCPECLADLDAVRIDPETCCPVCGAPLPRDEEGGDTECTFCREHPVTADSLRSAWMHRGLARNLVHELKYRHMAVTAEILAEGIALAAGETAPDTLVTWVTMPEKRRLRRGIDHGRLLAEGTARILGLECRPLLVRTEEKRDVTQRGLDAEQRRTHLRGLFTCPEDLTGRRVLVVDDVITTGSTLSVCAEVLREKGAAEVRGVSATRD